MFSPDLPITKSTEDILNRGAFAKSLAKAITQYSNSTSFTIGLYGAWGSGKTSLVNMVLESVESIDANAVVLRFNPWLCSDSKQLVSQFFKQMSTSIKLKKPSAKKAWEEKAWELIDQYADIFDAASLIPVVGTAVSAAGTILGKRARKRVELRSKDLQKSKDQIIKKMTEEKLKIVVSIDDIDRLSEEEIISVFQLVKVLADFPNTVYILTFDYDVVIRALSKVQHGDGKEYLEKIIQVPFEIPSPSMSSIHNALFSKLNSILGDIPEDRWAKTTWAELFQFGLQKYIKSLRDVNRYTNVFMLKYALLKEETDPVDLLGLSSLQVFEPSVYSKLPSYKDELCGGNHGYSYESQKADEEKTKKAVSQIIPNDGTVADSETANSILGILFPRTKTATGLSYSIGKTYSRRDFLVNNNISVPECFDRYFALALESDAIPTAEINELIYRLPENELNERVMRIYEEGKIIRLLEELEAYADREHSADISSERAALIITVLARNWNHFEVDDRDFFSVPFAWRLLFCVEPLLKAVDSATRFSFIKSVFDDENVQPSVVALLLRDFENQLGRFTDNASSGGDAIISLDEVLELEMIFKSRAVAAIESGSVLKQHQGLNFLWMLEKIDPELVEKIKESLVSDDISLVKIICYCTSLGTMTIKTVKKTREVNRKSLEEFVDVDEAYQRIKRFVATSQFRSLPRDDQMNVVAFIIGSEQKPSESRLDNCIAEDAIEKALNNYSREIHDNE